jgi:hypothetical protein
MAALSLVLFGLLLKPYSYVLSRAVGACLNMWPSFDTSGTEVTGSWFKVTLTFVRDGRPMTMAAGWVVINLAAFVALVGATPGIGWRRVARAVGIGCCIFFVWHVIQLSVLLLADVTTDTGVAWFVASVSTVLPFFAWIFLVRPPGVFDYFGKRTSEDNVERS